MPLRTAAVAGTFYPVDAGALRCAVEGYLAEASQDASISGLKALIVPHAGYVYSGPVAGTGYAQLAATASSISRVVLLGPSHRRAFQGVALSTAQAYATPLGHVPIDTELNAKLAELPGVQVLDEAHEGEHSLEVQLPFLQSTLVDFSLLPLVCGSASAEEIAAVLGAVWGGQETLIVVSTDLSHFEGYDMARRLDAETTKAIEALAPERLESSSACGRVPLRGLLVAAKRRGLSVRSLDLRNSGDTAGGHERVVGYGAYALF